MAVVTPVGVALEPTVLVYFSVLTLAATEGTTTAVATAPANIADPVAPSVGAKAIANAGAANPAVATEAATATPTTAIVIICDLVWGGRPFHALVAALAIPVATLATAVRPPVTADPADDTAEVMAERGFHPQCPSGSIIFSGLSRA